MATVDKWVGLGSAMIGLSLVLWSRLPDRVHDELSRFITTWMPMVASYFNPYEQVTISEYSEEQSRRSELFDTTAAYLNNKFVDSASKLKADLGMVDSDLPSLTLDENQEIADEFNGARIWWNLSRKSAKDTALLTKEDKMKKESLLYRAVFHKRDRLMLETYLGDILRKGRELTAKKKQRRLFRNIRFEGMWSHIPAELPATFEHLAMDPVEKKMVIDDLEAFKEGKSYYSMVGKAWKRGYLLYGPPGTGKSTMISAMANFLKYDVYDLDLTSVQSNDELRRLLFQTKGKSIVVIEDIDAIEDDLTSKRKDDENLGPVRTRKIGRKSGVTLSGLLNFADGLWSACGGERIFVFTTNYFDRLDPALTRSGRMDMRIEMSYCRFEAFKVFAKNYLDIKEHVRFDEIKQLLEKTDISPADVAHHLMPKKRRRDDDETSQEHLHQYSDECLKELVKTLKKPKKDSEATTSTQENGRASRPRRSTRVGKVKADVAHHLMPKRKRDAEETWEEHLRQCWGESLEELVKTLKKAKKDSEATTSTQENGRASRPRRSTRVHTEAQGRYKLVLHVR